MDIKTILPQDLQSWDSFLIVDVRQKWEWDIVHIEGSLNMPLDELALHYSDLPQGKPIVTICHHGVRSRRAAVFLEQQGLSNVYNLEGGIDRWAREIDKGMATY